MAGMAGGQVQQGQQMTPDDRPNMVICLFCSSVDVNNLELGCFSLGCTNIQSQSSTEAKYWTIISLNNFHSNPAKSSWKQNLFQGMPGTFDMSGNMAGAGAPGGIHQQQMITPGQQQAFARQQQQQLLGTKVQFYCAMRN